MTDETINFNQEATKKLPHEASDVVKKMSPLNETLGKKPFTYYEHRLEGKTSLWEDMIRNLHPSSQKQLTGLIFDDGFMVWSEEAVFHPHLADASGRDYYEAVAQFQSAYPPTAPKPELKIFWSKKEALIPIRDYFERNISTEVPVAIWSQPRNFDPNNSPIQIRQ